MIESIIGFVVCVFLYKISRSLGKMEASLGHVIVKIDDHETRIRGLEKE